MVHEPLSRQLAQILETTPASGQLTLNGLLCHTEGRGLFAVIILLCLPFVAPFSVPGMSRVLIWFGYTVSFGTTIYFAFWGEVIGTHLGQWIHKLAYWLQSLGL